MLLRSQLQLEFNGTFETETLERFIHDSQNQLTAQATISLWFPVLIECVALYRLKALA